MGEAPIRFNLRRVIARWTGEVARDWGTYLSDFGLQVLFVSGGYLVLFIAWILVPWDGKPGGTAMKEEILTGSVTILAVTTFGVFVSFVYVALWRTRPRLRLDAAAARFQDDQAVSQRSYVKSVLSTAFSEARYNVRRAALFGSMVHTGRTPRDIDVLIEFASDTNIGAAVTLLDRNVKPLIETAKLPVQWEVFTAAETAEVDAFLERASERGGYEMICWEEPK